MSDLKYGIMAGGALGAICTEQLIKSKSINFVLTDKLSFDIIELCHEYSIPVFTGNPRNGKTRSFIKDFITDVLVSVNYLFIIEADIISHAKKFAVNLHGSLLPKYRGRTPHVWAIINNETETGITAHLISAECDQGDIIYQEVIKIEQDDTGASILEKFNHRYPLIIGNIIEMIDNNTIKLVKQDDNKATYFGKRTLLDGEINWNWQKERIYNWVRAQAKPYPGAFSFYRGEDIVIHRIEFCDDGFNYNDENGKVLNGGTNPIIKTPNGAIKLVDLESPHSLVFKKGEALHGRH